MLYSIGSAIYLCLKYLKLCREWLAHRMHLMTEDSAQVANFVFDFHAYDLGLSARLVQQLQREHLDCWARIAAAFPSTCDAKCRQQGPWSVEGQQSVNGFLERCPSLGTNLHCGSLLHIWSKYLLLHIWTSSSAQKALAVVGKA